MTDPLLGYRIQDKRSGNCERGTENIDWSLCKSSPVRNDASKCKAVHCLKILFLSVDHLFLVWSQRVRCTSRFEFKCCIVNCSLEKGFIHELGEKNVRVNICQVDES